MIPVALQDGSLDRAVLDAVKFDAGTGLLSLRLSLPRWCGMSGSAPGGVILRVAAVRDVDAALPALHALQQSREELRTVRGEHDRGAAGWNLVLVPLAGDGRVQVQSQAAPKVILAEIPS